MNHTPRYRWAHPHEWFCSFVTDITSDETKSDLEKLRIVTGELRMMAAKLDADQLQDLYESDMDRDGYFTDLDAPVPDDEKENEP